MSLSVKIEGMEKLEKAFIKAPQIVATEINSTIKKALFELLAAIKPEIPSDTSQLRGSNITTFGQLTGEMKNTASYASFIHGDGTSTRSRPHFPPLDAIEPWARRHNIPAFLVARSIAKKGTKLVPFYKIGIEKTQSKIQDLFIKALNNIINKINS